MQPTCQHFQAAVAEDARRLLETFAHATPGVTLVVLTSADGFEIATHQRCLSTAHRLAAMGVSLWARFEAMSGEVELEGIRNLAIESDGGTATDSSDCGGSNGFSAAASAAVGSPAAMAEP